MMILIKKAQYAAVISWKTQLKTGTLTVIMMILMLKVLISVTSQVQTGLQRARIPVTSRSIVFDSCLMPLFQLWRKCGVTVKNVFLNGWGAFCYHCVHSWPHGGVVLSPFTQGVAAGNLSSGVILCTGHHFKRVGEAVSACNIRFVITFRGSTFGQ